MRLYLTASEEELPALPEGLGIALVDPAFGGGGPASGRDGVLLLGEELRWDQCGDIAAECRRRGFSAVLAGFGRPSALDVLRFCDALLRRRITPILPEESWQEGCGGELLLSSAISGGTLEERLREALRLCPDIALDLERLRHSFPLPCPDGQGEPISARTLEEQLRAYGSGSFSRELMCRALPVTEGAESRFLLYDDRETLCEKVRLAAALGVRRGFLLYPEWSPEDAAAALEAAAGKSPAITG